MQPDFTTSMPRVSKKTAIKILTSFFLFGCLFLQPQSPATKEVKADPCEYNSNVLDAKCKCERNQCRLSKTGSLPQFSDSGSNKSKNTPLFGAGEYDCFNGGEILGDSSGDIAKQRKYKAIFLAEGYSEAEELGTSNGANNECTNPDDLKSTLRIQYIDPVQYQIDELCDAKRANGEPIANGECSNGKPCYIFQSGGDTYPSDDNGNRYPPVPPTVRDAGLTGQGNYDLWGFFCSSSSFYVGTSGIADYCNTPCYLQPNSTDPQNPTFSCKTSCISIKDDVKNTRIIDCSQGGNNTGIGSNPSNFFQKYYADEFNRLPNNQNVPEGSVCKSIGGPSDGYAYWYYPKFFELVGGSGETNVCKPILVKRDLFGKDVNGTSTFLGCLPNSINGATAFFIRLAVGMAGFITLLVAVINLLKIIGSSNNPDAITEARKKMVGAVMTFIFLLSSLTILSILGLKILDIGGLGGGIFKLFTGG